MWRTGREKSRPRRFSITTWCERPIPSISRLRLAACAVSACCASTARVARIRRHDPRAQRDPLCLAPDQRGQRQRLVVVDLADPHQLDAPLLERRAASITSLERPRGEGREVDADAHAGMPLLVEEMVFARKETNLLENGKRFPAGEPGSARGGSKRPLRVKSWRSWQVLNPAQVMHAIAQRTHLHRGINRASVG